MDDLLITNTSLSSITKFKDYLSFRFHMKDLGPLKYFLGIKFACNSSGVYLCQRNYILEILSETGLSTAKPSSTPLEPNHNLATATGDLFSMPDRCQQLIGKFMYLSLTRPDLAFAIHILAQFKHAPQQAHCLATLRVVRYLKGLPSQGILLRVNSPLILTAYCDSNWTNCPFTWRFVTGYFVSLGCSPISWKTKKQPTVSRSSTEAKYKSMAVTLCELKWLR